jgi:PAS domain S-box-containing protein
VTAAAHDPGRGTGGDPRTEELERIFLLSQDFMCIAGLDGTLRRVNPTFVRALGWGERELLAMSQALVHPEDRASLAETLGRLARSGGTTSFTIRCVCKDGSHRWIDWQATALLDEGTIVAVGRDVTERRLEEDERRRTHALLDSIVANFPHVLFVKDAQSLRFLRVSNEVRTVMGLAPEAFVGKTDHDIFPPEQANFFREMDEKTLAGGVRVDIPAEPVDDGRGGTRWVRTVKVPIFGDDGRPLYLFGYAEDITERLLAEQALAETQGLLRNAFDGAPTGIAMISADEERRFLRVNPALCSFLGYGEEELLRMSAPDVTHPDDRDLTVPFVEEAVHRGRSAFQLEKRYVRKDGEVVWGHLNASLVDGPAGQPGYFVCHIQDVTARRTAEEERARTQALLDAIVQNVPGMLFVKDADELRFVRASKAWLDLVGHRPEDVVGRTDFDFFTREQAEFFRSVDRQVLEARQRVDIHEEAARTAQGHDVLLRTAKVPILDERGEPVYVLGYAEDITESKRAEAALRESEARFRSLVANIPGAVYRCGLDEHWTMEYISDEIEAISGYPASDFVGNAVRSYASIIHPEDRRPVADAIASSLEAADGFVIEYRILDAAGQVRWVYEKGQVVLGGEGSPVWLDGVILDVTERKLAEAERDRMEVDLRMAQKLEAVGQLAAGIAHEINTPIQFVGDTTQFIEECFRDYRRLLAEYRAAVAEGVDAARAERLARLEDEVDLEYLEARLPSAFARAFETMSHQDRADAAPADLNEALEATLTVCRNEWKYVADVELDLAEIPPVVCRIGDLNQVFLNLVVNAAHAIADKTGGGEERGRIAVRTRPEGDRVAIEIADTGGGIPGEIRDRVFDPFFTTKEVGRGSGQGLAIARSIIDKHGGSLSFESAPGEGTTFRITLPVAGEAVVEREAA